MNESNSPRNPVASPVAGSVNPERTTSGPRRTPSALLLGLTVALTAGAAGLALGWLGERFEVLSGDRRIAGALALLAAIAAAAGSLWAARTATRRNPGVMWRLIAAAIGLVVLGLGWPAVPREGVGPAPVLDAGFAFLVALVLVALGGLIPAWAALSPGTESGGPGRTVQRAWIPGLVLAAAGCGLGISLLAPDRLPDRLEPWILVAALFLVAAVLARWSWTRGRAAGADQAADFISSTAAGMPVDSAGSTPPPSRFVPLGLTAVLGLALGSSTVLLARYGSVHLPAGAPTGAGITGLVMILVGVSAWLAVVVLGRLPGRAGLAFLALALAAWCTAREWSSLVESCLTAPGPDAAPTGALLPAFQALVLDLAPWAAALGAATGLGFMVSLQRRASGPGLGVAFGWWASGAAIGAGLAAPSLPLLGWQAVWTPVCMLALGAGLVLNLDRRLRWIRAPAGVLAAVFLGYVALSTSPLPPPTHDAPTPDQSHGPLVWSEFRSTPGLRGHEQVVLDRRVALGPANQAELRTASLQAHLPILLRRTQQPGSESSRVLVLQESLGDVTRAALEHPGVRLVVSWLNRAVMDRFAATLQARARRDGRSLVSRTGLDRWFLETHPGRFSVIVDRHPGSTADGPLDRRTADYFRAARRALEPGGLYCLWVPFDRLRSADEARHLAAAFAAAFPRSCRVITPGLLSPRPILGWLGSADDVPLLPDRISESEATKPSLVFDPDPLLADPSTLIAQLSAAAWPAALRTPRSTASGRRPFRRDSGRYLDPVPRPDEAEAVYDAFLNAARTAPSPTDLQPEPDRDHAVRRAARRIAQVQRFRQRAVRDELSRAQALDAALALARELLERAGHLPAVWPFVDDVARECRSRGLRDEALDLYERARRQAPNWGGGYLGVASFRFENYRNFRTPAPWRELEDLAEKALARNARLARAWTYLGVIHYLDRNDAAEARKCFENAAMIDPDDPLMKSWLWLFMDRDGRVEEAAAMLLDAVEADPRNTRLLDALYKLVPKLRLAGKHQQALYVLKTLAPCYERDAGYYLILFEVLEASGDLAGSVDAIRTCCHLVTPPVQGYYLHLYRLLRKVGSAREAEETREFMIRQFGRDPAEMLGDRHP